MSLIGTLKLFLADKTGKGWTLKTGNNTFICSQQDEDSWVIIKDPEIKSVTLIASEDGCKLYAKHIELREATLYLETEDKVWYISWFDDRINRPEPWTVEYLKEQQKNGWKV